jgi:hypothetical protein
MRHASRTIPVLQYCRRAAVPSPRGRRATLLVISLLASAIPALAPASELTVRVFERGGKQPLAGVSVCLGTSANTMQFGSDRTDREGYAVFTEVPRAPLVVTASKFGYRGEQESLVTKSYERLLVMSLASGGGGPECTSAGGKAALGTGGLQIHNFRINKGAAVSSDRRVHLNYDVSGHPNQYRVSEGPDISQSEWQSYSSKPTFTLSPGNGKKTVYLQVRRYSRINGAAIETVSPVAHDSIVLQRQ